MNSNPHYRPMTAKQQQTRLVAEYRRKSDPVPQGDGPITVLLGAALAATPAIAFLVIFLVIGG